MVKSEINDSKSLKGGINSIGKEISKLIITALGFVTALAWNDAFQNFFKKNCYLNVFGPWVYAILITFITVISVIYLKKFMKNGNFTPENLSEKLGQSHLMEGFHYKNFDI